MNNRSAFHRFAPTILKIYRRNKEAFWEAVLAPFLSTGIKHLRIDMELLSAFKGLDEEARQLLKDFSSRFGVDVTERE